MSDRHLTLAEIAVAARLPQDDPRRRHLDACARCRTLVVRHEQFLAQSAHVPQADLRDAEARLAGFLAGEIAQAEASPRSPEMGPVHRVRAWRDGSSRWFGAPALAVAAAALVVGGVFIARNLGGPGDGASGVLRGQAREGPDTELVLMAARPLTAGGVELRWHPASAADRYEVSLYSAELRALAVLATARETVLVLAPGNVPGAAAGDTLLWRVAAFRGEARLAQSSPGIVCLP